MICFEFMLLNLGSRQLRDEHKDAVAVHLPQVARIFSTVSILRTLGSKFGLVSRYSLRALKKKEVLGQACGDR